jgi:hypothetical protein
LIRSFNLASKCSTKLVKTEQETIKRDAFLYLDPKGDQQQEFAQCETCIMFTGDRCVIHGPDQPVDSDDSCGFYLYGLDKIDVDPIKIVTPQESGLVDREVRCENCAYFNEGESTCDLYDKLNSRLPDVFELDNRVDKNGCCNAQTPKPDALNSSLTSPWGMCRRAQSRTF